jgi:hypothetical protein
MIAPTGPHLVDEVASYLPIARSFPVKSIPLVGPQDPMPVELLADLRLKRFPQKEDGHGEQCVREPTRPALDEQREFSEHRPELGTSARVPALSPGTLLALSSRHRRRFREGSPTSRPTRPEGKGARVELGKQSTDQAKCRMDDGPIWAGFELRNTTPD